MSKVSKPSKPSLGTLDTPHIGGIQEITPEHNDAIREHLEAHKALRVFQYRLTDNPDAWLVMIAPGCDLDEATEGLRARFGKRLIDVTAYEFDRHTLADDRVNTR